MRVSLNVGMYINSCMHTCHIVYTALTHVHIHEHNTLTGGDGSLWALNKYGQCYRFVKQKVSSKDRGDREKYRPDDNRDRAGDTSDCDAPHTTDHHHLHHANNNNQTNINSNHHDHNNHQNSINQHHDDHSEHSGQSSNNKDDHVDDDNDEDSDEGVRTCDQAHKPAHWELMPPCDQKLVQISVGNKVCAYACMCNYSLCLCMLLLCELKLV